MSSWYSEALSELLLIGYLNNTNNFLQLEVLFYQQVGFPTASFSLFSRNEKVSCGLSNCCFAKNIFGILRVLRYFASDHVISAVFA